MLRNFLLPEGIARADGTGPEFQLGPNRGKLLVLTLGITRIIEQESLDVSIWGSADGENWGLRPLTKFPPKFYCGIYSVLLNLASQPDIGFVRVDWKMSRWSRGEATPMFGFYVYAEESGARISTAVA
ncbi:MAG TPA: hypothetical protein VNX70_02955 [Bryobacteraceae bacterium]|nr:hypothetical protein [Bryobacteraceae bacterium]